MKAVFSPAPSTFPSGWSRRDFVRASTATALCAATPLSFSRRLRDDVRVRQTHLAQLADPAIMRDLALRAVDAARAAGARYAEARVTRTVQQEFDNGRYGTVNRFGFEAFVGYTGFGKGGISLSSDWEQLALGIRILMPGGWGFVACPSWQVDEVGRLAQEAVVQAKANGTTFPREIDLGHYPVATGSWTTPHELDPFLVSFEEKLDFVESWEDRVPDHPLQPDRGGSWLSGANMTFYRQERTIATTEGALFAQTVYRTGGGFGLKFGNEGGPGHMFGGKPGNYVDVAAHGLGLTAGGWDVFVKADIPGQIPQLKDEALRLGASLTFKPVETGRYDIVCDAATMAQLVDHTFARATQLDRALGFEANASGTSYLGPDPLDLLGTFTFHSPLLTVTANRSMIGGLATVKWDDEGVEPETTTLVEKGILTDYQTTREQAAWLAPYYQKVGKPVRSHGYAGSESGLGYPLQCTPNLVLEPGTATLAFDDMVASTKKGIAIVDGNVHIDFQDRTGVLVGNAREIVNGRLGAVLNNAGVLFDAPSLWKNLTAVGGPASATMYYGGNRKGEPVQSTMYSVTAVPGAFQNQAIIDITKKA